MIDVSGFRVGSAVEEAGVEWRSEMWYFSAKAGDGGSLGCLLITRN